MAAPASSFKTVLVALLASSFVTLIKFVAFALSGSGAMLSESIHGASIVVDLLLGVIALCLILENRALLLGRAVPDGVEDRFVRILNAWPTIRHVHDVKTRQLTPEAFKLKAEVAFDEVALAARFDAVLPPPRSPATASAADRRCGGWAVRSNTKRTHRSGTFWAWPGAPG